MAPSRSQMLSAATAAGVGIGRRSESDPLPPVLGTYSSDFYVGNDLQQTNHESRLKSLGVTYEILI